MLVLHGLFIGSQTIWVTLDVLLHIVILPENNKRIHQVFKEITLTHSVQFSSVTQSCPTLWPHESQDARHPCPSPFRSLLKPMSLESVMPSSHLILCHPLLLLPPAPNPLPPILWHISFLYSDFGNFRILMLTSYIGYLLPYNKLPWNHMT